VSDYKKKYKSLKKKLKFLVFEQETLREELCKSQRRLIQASRDKTFLLDRLLQFEDPTDSDADSDATASSDSDCETGRIQTQSTKESASPPDLEESSLAENTSRPQAFSVDKSGNSIPSTVTRHQDMTIGSGEQTDLNLVPVPGKLTGKDRSEFSHDIMPTGIKRKNATLYKTLPAKLTDDHAKKICTEGDFQPGSVSTNLLQNIQILLQQKSQNIRLMEAKKSLINQAKGQPLVAHLLKQIQLQQLQKQSRAANKVVNKMNTESKSQIQEVETFTSASFDTEPSIIPIDLEEKSSSFNGGDKTTSTYNDVIVKPAFELSHQQIQDKSLALKSARNLSKTFSENFDSPPMN